MAIDDLKNKYFVLKNDKGCFCSKCGKKLANDSYIITKHQDECKVKFEDRFKAYDEKDRYGYAFRILNGKLTFIVYQLQLEYAPGFSDRYNGAKWKQIFTTTFERGKKELVEKGLYNIDVWLKMLVDSPYAVCLNKNNPHDVIRNCFKSIPFIYSYGMFVDIYRQRGYRYNNIDIQKVLLIPDENIDLKFAKKHTKLSTLVDVYEHRIGEEILLEMNVYKNFERVYRVFVSKDFYYCDKEIDYCEIFGLKGQIVEDRYRGKHVRKVAPIYRINNIENFNKKYPELMVEKYLESGGTNLFQIIMSPNYNKIIENLGKGGLGYISDNAELLHFKNPYGNNVKEIFGFNTGLIKCFNNGRNIDYLEMKDFEEFILKIQSIQPAIFNLELSKSALDLLYHNFIDKNNYYKIDGLNLFNKDELLKVVKVFSEKDIDIYYYRDYMRMCKDLDAYPYGKIPKDIVEAHEYVSEIYECHKDRILDEKFRQVVSMNDYLIFDSTAEFDKDGNIHYKHNKDKYRIICPKKQYDLTKESECLNHCVRTYIKQVANGGTYILFLRKADDLKTPFATIEVKKDKTLIQLKAMNNRHAPLDAQKFVKDWAIEKNVRINSHDFD